MLAKSQDDYPTNSIQLPNIVLIGVVFGVPTLIAALLILCGLVCFSANVIQYGMDHVHDAPMEDSILYIRSTTTTDCKHRAITMLVILVQVSVKVACRSTTATDCSHRAITMLLILAEVSVKVVCWSTITTDCKHSAIIMLLILVEVSVKVACRSTTATDCGHRAIHATYSGGVTMTAGPTA